MQTIRHMSTNIEGILKNYKSKKIDFLDDEKGKTMTDADARKALAELQAKGHKLIPSGNCEGFDPFGGGCPGHPIIELEKSKFSYFGKVEQCQKFNGEFHLKITDGFDNNAIKTFDLIRIATEFAGKEYPLIGECTTDKNLFHLILKKDQNEGN